jgi:hypothetical protein
MQFTIFGYFRINQPMKPLLIAIVFFFTITRTTAQIGWCGFGNELNALQQDSLDFTSQDQYFSSGLARFRAQEGNVHMMEREGLSDEEIEEGYVLTCQALPRSSEIELTFE